MEGHLRALLEVSASAFKISMKSPHIIVCLLENCFSLALNPLEKGSLVSVRGIHFQ